MVVKYIYVDKESLVGVYGLDSLRIGVRVPREDFVLFATLSRPALKTAQLTAHWMNE
jgi:hypothetical protein